MRKEMEKAKGGNNRKNFLDMTNSSQAYKTGA